MLAKMDSYGRLTLPAELISYTSSRLSGKTAICRQGSLLYFLNIADAREDEIIGIRKLDSKNRIFLLSFIEEIGFSRKDTFHIFLQSGYLFAKKWQDDKKTDE